MQGKILVMHLDREREPPFRQPGHRPKRRALRRDAAMIGDLLRGRVSHLSLDPLVNIATAPGCRVRVDLDAA
jgi:hypothetical protein